MFEPSISINHVGINGVSGQIQTHVLAIKLEDTFGVRTHGEIKRLGLANVKFKTYCMDSDCDHAMRLKRASVLENNLPTGELKQLVNDYCDNLFFHGYNGLIEKVCKAETNQLDHRSFSNIDFKNLLIQTIKNKYTKYVSARYCTD